MAPCAKQLGGVPGRKDSPLYRFAIDTVPVAGLPDESFMLNASSNPDLPTTVEYNIPLGFGTSLEAVSLEEIEPLGLSLLGNIGE